MKVSTVATDLATPAEWAKANGYGINTVYEYLRREKDPMPHVLKGGDKMIDCELALQWLRRNFGVNTEGR